MLDNIRLKRLRELWVGMMDPSPGFMAGSVKTLWAAAKSDSKLQQLSKKQQPLRRSDVVNFLQKQSAYVDRSRRVDKHKRKATISYGFRDLAQESFKIFCTFNVIDYTVSLVYSL